MTPQTESLAAQPSAYQNGPEGMPRVKRMSDAVLDCIIDSSPFRYLANWLEGEALDLLHGLMHHTAEEVLARVPAWPATQPQAGVAAPTYQVQQKDFASCWCDVSKAEFDACTTPKRIVFAAPSATGMPGARVDTPEFEALAERLFFNDQERKEVTAYIDAQLARLGQGEPVRITVEHGCVTHVGYTSKVERFPDGTHELYTAPAAQAAQGDAVRDAERYRWLRNSAAGQFEHPIVVSQHHEVGRGMRYMGPVISRELDRLIDAAMSVTHPEGK